MEFDRSRLFDNLQSDQVKVGDYGTFGYDPYSVKKAVESDKPISRGVITAIRANTRNPYEKNYIKQGYACFYKMTKEEFCKRVPHDSSVKRLIDEINKTE